LDDVTVCLLDDWQIPQLTERHYIWCSVIR